MNLNLVFVFVFAASLGLVPLTQAFAEGGGGIECPEISGPYFYLPGTASYEVTPFEVGEIAVLSCEYLTEIEDVEVEPLGQINSVYHITGELNQELIDEYGCGAILGEQYSSTYVSSSTHFASVAFSSPHLIEAANDIMNQIEQQNLASGCILANQEVQASSTAENVKEAVDEHEEIQDSAIEISNEEIDEQTIETIKEQIGAKKIDDAKLKDLKPLASEILLPDWIKNNAEWWSSDQITNDDFSLGIEFMIKEGFIKVPVTEVSTETSSDIPDWVKNNAGWWSEGMISDIDFVNGLQFLISNGIINVA